MRVCSVKRGWAGQELLEEIVMKAGDDAQGGKDGAREELERVSEGIDMGQRMENIIQVVGWGEAKWGDKIERACDDVGKGSAYSTGEAEMRMLEKGEARREELMKGTQVEGAGTMRIASGGEVKTRERLRLMQEEAEKVHAMETADSLLREMRKGDAKRGGSLKVGEGDIGHMRVGETMGATQGKGGEGHNNVLAEETKEGANGSESKEGDLGEGLQKTWEGFGCGVDQEGVLVPTFNIGVGQTNIHSGTRIRRKVRQVANSGGDGNEMVIDSDRGRKRKGREGTGGEGRVEQGEGKKKRGSISVSMEIDEKKKVAEIGGGHLREQQ